MNIKINFAPNTKEQNFLLFGGARELLQFALQYLVEFDSVSFTQYTGYVFSISQGDKVDLFTSIEKLERKLLFMTEIEYVCVELITRSRQYLLTNDLYITSRNCSFTAGIPIAKLKTLFFAVEFGGWIDCETRIKNWETMKAGKGPFRTVIVLMGCVVTFDCFIISGKVNSASIRLSRKRGRR